MPLFGPNIGKLKRKQDLDGLIEALVYPKDPAVPEASAQALVEIGHAGVVDTLCAALSRSEAGLSEAAAEVLGRIGDSRAVEPLAAALQHPLIAVRQSAAEALGRIGGARSVEVLLAALNVDYYQGSRPIIEALVRIGDPQAVGPLCPILERHLTPSETRNTLARFGPRASEALVAALRNPAWRKGAEKALDSLGWQPDKSAAGAAYWLARGDVDRCAAIGAPAVGALCAALQDPDWRLRQTAVETLNKLGWQPDMGEAGAAYWILGSAWDKCVEIGTPAVRPLIAALSDPSADKRLGAVHALGQIGDPRAVKPLIDLLDSSPLDVRREAASALMALYQSGSLDAAGRRAIVAARRFFTTHNDTIDHTDFPYCGYHDDSSSHGDHGTGVAFPL